MEVALVEMAERAAPGGASANAHRRDPVRCRPQAHDHCACRVCGSVAYTKGAPETVLPLCTGAASRQESVDARDAAPAAEELAAKGLRVLALAYRRLAPDELPPTDEHDLVLLGLVGLEDPPRDGVAAAVGRRRRRASG